MTPGNEPLTKVPMGVRARLGYPVSPVDARAARRSGDETGSERVQHGARH